MLEKTKFIKERGIWKDPIRRTGRQSAEKVETVGQEYVRKYFLALYDNFEHNQVCKIPIYRKCREQRNTLNYTMKMWSAKSRLWETITNVVFLKKKKDKGCRKHRL